MRQLEGIKFGRLTFLARGQNPRKATFRCDCGAVRDFFITNVTTGKSSSCGCLARESVIRRSTIHGHAKRGQHTRAYETWANMISRCTQSGREDFDRYGGRGITVCKRWLSFANFYADVGDPPPGKSIDRKDNMGNYTPSNFRWATAKEQANNRRNRKRAS